MVISLAVIVILVSVVVVNMPTSSLRRDVGQYTLPITNATGLNQDWSIFSNPRTISTYVDARIDFADGSSRVQTISIGQWLSAYADYRWQKYEETLRPNSGRKYWRGYAEYVAAQARRPGREPVRVTLIQRSSPTLPPGPGPARGPWTVKTLYVLDPGQSG